MPTAVVAIGGRLEKPGSVTAAVPRPGCWALDPGTVRIATMPAAMSKPTPPTARSAAVRVGAPDECLPFMPMAKS